jgi:hypothetical protein
VPQAHEGVAGIGLKTEVETEDDKPWKLKDLCKPCATYYDEHMPESSVEVLGHSVGSIIYRHYAHRAPLAFEAIMTLPQPTAFSALARGFESECPCCRRPVAATLCKRSMWPLLVGEFRLLHRWGRRMARSFPQVLRAN